MVLGKLKQTRKAREQRAEQESLGAEQEGTGVEQETIGAERKLQEQNAEQEGAGTVHQSRGAELGTSLFLCLVAPCVFLCHLFLVWCVWLFLCFFAVALALPFDGPVHLNASLLASCFWVLLSFFGLQSLLLACLGLLVLLCVDLACFQSAGFCISFGLIFSGFFSANDFFPSSYI